MREHGPRAQHQVPRCPWAHAPCPQRCRPARGPVPPAASARRGHEDRGEGAVEGCVTGTHPLDGDCPCNRTSSTLGQRPGMRPSTMVIHRIHGTGAACTLRGTVGRGAGAAWSSGRGWPLCRCAACRTGWRNKNESQSVDSRPAGRPKKVKRFSNNKSDPMSVKLNLNTNKFLFNH